MNIQKQIASNHCKVCQSGLRDKVDTMLATSIPLRQIADWMMDQIPGYKICASAIHTHNKRHRLPSLSEAITSEAAEIPSQKDMAQIKSQALSIIQDKNPLTVSQFCDLVIAKSTELIITGEMHPTVSDATKAAELKQRIKSGSPFEAQLVALFLDISKNHNIINP